MPEIDLSDPEVVRDPFAAYGRVREQAPLARLRIPGLSPWWVVTRHEAARAMLADPRLEIRADSFMRPGVPDDCLPYMRTMSELNGSEHARMRKLVAPAFTPRRAAEFRPRIERIVDRLLDDVEKNAAADGTVDLLPHFARPLPMDVICELVGVPGSDRPRWRAYGATVAAGAGGEFAEAIPGIMDGAKAAIARRRAEPGDDLLADLITAQAEDGDRLTDAEMVTLVWHLVIAGQTPANLIANAVVALLTHPGRREALRDDPDLMPGAVEELIRWCGPTLLSIPRYAREDVELCGVRVRAGEAVTAAVAAANRDPRVFTDPERLDVTRPKGPYGHLGFAHGPHFCVGASIARVQTQVALTALLRRHPSLGLAAEPEELRAPDPGTWRLTALPVTLGE
ncbi:cytochrome P450 family protein [Actinoallomurus sp. CA-142502]|uniref:cytochrome P450 family protein n=1 Tax=Actinoallomurus sp. CA-142502 TaxID=3239885 RepID=UPI003D8A4D0F